MNCIGTMTPSIHRGSAGLFDRYAGAWGDLCRRSASDEPFFRPEWIAAYVRAFEPEADVLLVTAGADDQLHGLLPLLEEATTFCGFPVRMLRGAANAHSCRFDLVRSTGEEGELAVRAIWEALKDQSGWDLIELPYVPENGCADQLLQQASRDGFLTGRYDSYKSPYVRLCDRGSGEGALSARFRRNLQRRWRKARDNWNIRLTRTDHADPASMSRFFELEASGWKGKEKTAISCSEPTRHFYEEIARAASQCGYFSLYLLEFGDSVAAGHFGLSYRQRYYSPKVAYNETFAEYGPGHLMVDAILQDIQPRNFSEFDFLGPWMEWKGEWARKGRTHSFCYIFKPGLFGHTLHSVKLKLLPALRRITPLRRIVQAVS